MSLFIIDYTYNRKKREKLVQENVEKEYSEEELKQINKTLKVINIYLKTVIVIGNLLMLITFFTIIYFVVVEKINILLTIPLLIYMITAVICEFILGFFKKRKE